MSAGRWIVLAFAVFGLNGGHVDSANTVETVPRPPVAAKVPHIETRLGKPVPDDYFWLRHRGDPRVLKYLAEENNYTAAWLHDTEPLQKQLYREMLARIQETDRTVPEPIGEYEYYIRTVEGKPYKIHCRRKRGSAAEEIVLDENALARGHEHFRLGPLRESPDQKRIAYSVDFNGSERFTVHFRDVAGGTPLPETIAGTADSIEWGADDRTVFYTVVDAANRPYRVYRHELGTDPKRDPLVYEEPDEAFFIRVYKTKSRKFLVMHLQSDTTCEDRILEADHPSGAFRIIRPRKNGVEYRVEDRGSQFYIWTNDAAKNFKIVRAPTDDPSERNWRDFLPYRPEIKIDEFTVFAGHLALLERQNGLRSLRIVDFNSGEQHRVPFSEQTYTVELDKNPEFNTRVLRFTFSSLTTPASVFDYDMQTHTRQLRKRKAVLGGYKAENYISERIWAAARDGKQVPISLLYRKGLRRHGKSPMLLEGYGAYGINNEPDFDSPLFSLVDRGFVYAIAHVRGGGDLGRDWYEDGKLLHKRNTFTDFIACAEKLIADRYTSADRLAIRGASAGGLLIGAVVNMRPDLFRVAVAHVPFVDVVNTMSDPNIPLTVTEWEEWGDPRREPDYDYIRSYSPYDNVRPQTYPSLFVTAGLNDPRVCYWEPAKWVARLRAVKMGNRTLLLKTNLSAGHGGRTGLYGALEDISQAYAFILKELGVR